jgi:hypothetical protein
MWRRTFACSAIISLLQMVWFHIEIPCLLGSALISAFSPRQQPPLPAHVIRHNVKRDAVYFAELHIRAPTPSKWYVGSKLPRYPSVVKYILLTRAAILPHSFSAKMCYRQVQCALHSICGHQEPRAHSTVSVLT